MPLGGQHAVAVFIGLNHAVLAQRIQRKDRREGFHRLMMRGVDAQRVRPAEDGGKHRIGLEEHTVARELVLMLNMDLRPVEDMLAVRAAHGDVERLFATANGQDRLVPTTLRAYAKLEKDVVISGAGRHVEVWNRDDFFRFIEET